MKTIKNLLTNRIDVLMRYIAFLITGVLFTLLFKIVEQIILHPERISL